MKLPGETILDSEENLTDLTLTKLSTDELHAEKHNVSNDRLMDEIRSNFWGCDLILCLFISALRSYRAHQCLRPFPPFYIKQQDKDFNHLRNTCDNIPSVDVILEESKKCSDDILKLLRWLFLDKGYPKLRRVNFDNVVLPNQIDKTFVPHYIFEVLYQNRVEENWEKRKGDRNIILAYHGSSIDNFYSILKVGLQQHFSLEREGLFGNGIYLSNEISISAHYAPFKQTWKNSKLGGNHSIIAVCEVINDLNKVKCKDLKNKNRSINKNSMGEIPEKYFVVTDSDMVRVKYLMVYRKKQIFSVKSYMAEHLFIILLLLYFLLIVLIGFYNNGAMLKYYKWLNKLFNKF